MNRRQAILSAGAALGAAGSALIAVPMLGGDAEACEVKGTPLEAMHLHLCAFHVPNDDPKFQVEAHHYCMPLAEEYADIFQCIITESNKVGARIMQWESIISENIYQKLANNNTQ